jgi:MFS family permease
MEREFGFGNFGNLSVSATYGFVYAFSSLFGGKFGQRQGYLRALALGFAIMIVALSSAYFAHRAGGQIGWMIVWTIGVCFTWPALEALVSEGEGPMGVQRMVGIYNLTWSSASALAYFSGGAILEKFGVRSIFWLPVVVHSAQLGLLAWLAVKSKSVRAPESKAVVPPTQAALRYELNPRPIARARMFLRLAWTANPFAYVAINTLAAVIPGLARELNLTPMLAGFFCSIWFFVRWFTFLALWLWPGWHYRGPWFFGAFGLMILSFALILLVPNLVVIVFAQVGFGAAVGLIYYSSLFYSMDAGEAKGEHGGVHEAAIGLGIFMGPAVGATTLKIFPDSPNSGIWAVCVLLCLGFALLAAVRNRDRS